MQNQIKEVQNQLAMVTNDPDYVSVCWSFTYCLKCRDENGNIVNITDCTCPNNPSKMHQKELKEWFKLA